MEKGLCLCEKQNLKGESFLESENNKTGDLKAIEQADRFIQRLHDLEIIFKSRPKKEKELKAISRDISFYTFKYQQQKSGYYKGFYARLLLGWINRAYTMGFIEIGDGIQKKIIILIKILEYNLQIILKIIGLKMFFALDIMMETLGIK